MMNKIVYAFFCYCCDISLELFYYKKYLDLDGENPDLIDRIPKFKG